MTRKEIITDNCMKCIRNFHKLTKGEQNFVGRMLKISDIRPLTTEEFNRLHRLANPQGTDEQQILFNNK